jgi:hypothetical protein
MVQSLALKSMAFFCSFFYYLRLLLLFLFSMNFKYSRLIIILVCLLLGSLACDSNSDAVVAAASEQAEVAPAISLKKTDFESRLHVFLKEVNVSKTIDSLSQRAGDSTHVVSVQISSRTVLTCKLDNTGTYVSDANLLFIADGRPNAGMEMIIMMHALIHATNPALSIEEREQILRKVGFITEGTSDFSQLAGKDTVNGVGYTIGYIEDLGIMFSALLTSE